MRKVFLISIVTALICMTGCQKKAEESPKVVGTPITVGKISTADVLYIERSLGVIDAKNAPMINAEVNGQVSKVLCEIGDKVSAGQMLAVIDATQYQNAKDSSQAQVKLYESQLENQKKTVERYEELLKQNFISQAKLDDLITQKKAYEEQLAFAKASLKEQGRSLDKGTVRSPISGVVYARNVSVGDFASIGRAMFGVVNSDLLVIKAPFPEGVGGKIKKGQKVLLSIGGQNQKTEGAISDIKPYVSANGRSFEAVVSVKNPGSWLAGGSINVEVFTDEHKKAFVVPESSVVLRPAGNVVYVVSGDVAKQKVVTIGEKQNGSIELLSGVDGSEIVAVDGAGLLSDGAKITTQVKK